MAGKKKAESLALREITERDIENLRGIDDLDAADIYDARMRALEAQTRRSYVEIGLICVEMRERSLWLKVIDVKTAQYFHSFDAWLMSAAGVSRSSAYAAMKAIDMLTDVPIADLREIPRCNAMNLGKLSTAVRREPEILQAAKDLTEEEFVAKVQSAYPEQHLEGRSRLQLAPTQSARHAIDRALEVSMWVWDLESKEQALEAIAAYFLDGGCEREGFDDKTNRMAFEASRQVRASA
jgi:hypothetical protein